MWESAAERVRGVGRGRSLGAGSPRGGRTRAGSVLGQESETVWGGGQACEGRRGDPGDPGSVAGDRAATRASARLCRAPGFQSRSHGGTVGLTLFAQTLLSGFTEI